MVIGQGAGIAAALAADKMAVQELPYPYLRKRLLAQRQVLELPDVLELPSADRSVDPKTLPGIVLDDDQATLVGKWTHSTKFQPYIGNGYVYAGGGDSSMSGDGKSTASFRFKPPTSGRYDVFLSYSAHKTRAKNVPVTIAWGTDHKTILVDQTKPLPEGKRFRKIHTVDLKSDIETLVQISNGGTKGFVILDALLLLPHNETLKRNKADK
jgi:hypothetical protein